MDERHTADRVPGEGRSLEIIGDEAEFVRHIFERYIDLGNVRALRDELHGQRRTAPIRTTGTGKTFGGQPLTRGQLYVILKNPIYLGLISHKGTTYPGLHDAIIRETVFQTAQQKLTENLRGHRDRARAKAPSLLAGKLIDETGQAMIATHATKGSRRYRYYVSDTLHHREGDGLRIPARKIDGAVSLQITQLFKDPLALLTRCGLAYDPADLRRLSNCPVPDTRAIATIVDEVRVLRASIEIRCHTTEVARELGVKHTAKANSHLVLTVPATLSRTGRVLRLVHGASKPLVPARDRSVPRLLARAHAWWAELRKGQIDVETLAASQGVGTSYFARVLRLAFLSPELTAALLNGRCALDAEDLVKAGAVADRWLDQRQLLLGSNGAE